MTTEKKLRDALQEVIAYARESGHDWLCLTEAEQALATTEPVMSNGLTEAETDASAAVVGLSRSRDSLNKLVDIMRWVDAYAYDCAKEGKFTKSRQQVEWSIIHELNKISPTGKQPLQVEPVVSQQLTTEPFDEREAFEKWAAPNRFDIGHKGEDGSYLGRATSIAWTAWQARAAMAQGVK